MTAPYFLGIDIGTQGARVVLIDASGILLGAAEESFALNSKSREEQSPQEWWAACLRCLQNVLATARCVINVEEVLAVSVTSTSGTVIPLDRHNEPLHNAIMYSDKRSSQEGKLCSEIAAKFNPGGYTGFNSSSGLSKMVWFVKTFPEKAEQISRWVHAADYLIGKLSGRWGVTDYTNALKSGYDLKRNQWPDYLYSIFPLRQAWLPEVVPSGTVIGSIEPLLASILGMSKNTMVVAGMTDGCASQVASGAVKPGDWNTTIGTTLVIKGVTTEPISDPHDRLYNHRHPDGYWMPGGASNLGADWVTDYSSELARLTEEAAHLVPTGKLSYPLRQTGERFPFVAPEALGFEPEGLSKAELFAAGLEGVAYIERYAFEIIEKLSGERVTSVYTAGGASNNELWLQIRSNVLNLPGYKMKHVNGAFGAAIIAASQTFYSSLTAATKNLAHVANEIQPQAGFVEKYHKIYHQFLNLLASRGYISKETYA